MTLTVGLTDEDLALRASSGDKDAFSVLYERHFRGVYDLVIRMIREHELAVDVVQNSFLNAWVNLQKRTVTGNIKAWLYTIARNSAINELRRGKRFVRLAEETPDAKYPPAFARIDADRLADPQNIVEDSEIVDLVWTSAAALSSREYSLLDLHVRRGLSTDDLSHTLGVPKSNLYTQLSRLKDSLEESVTVALLMRRARNDCAELDALAAAAGAGLTRDVRQVVARHVRDCERCQESRKRYLAPGEIFAGLALVPAPAGADKIWLGATAGAGVLGVVVTALLTPVRWLISLLREPGAPFKAAVGASVAGIVAVPAVVVILVSVGGGGDATRSEPAAAGVQPQISRSPAASAPATPPITPAPTLAGTLAPTTTPTPAVAAAVAAPVLVPVAAQTQAPTPTEGTQPASGGATPTPTPTPAAPAAAPTPIPAQIQFTPPKQIQLHSSATMLVTMFGSPILPTSDVNVDTVRLGDAPVRQAQVKDVDGNGEPDLVLHFKVPEIAIPANGEVCIEGETLRGMRFAGCGLVSARLHAQQASRVRLYLS